MSELQIGGIITVFSDLILRYIVGKYYCVQFCVYEVQGEGNVIL